MRINDRWIPFTCLTLATVVVVPTVSAQVLPRNKNRRAETTQVPVPQSGAVIRGGAQVETPVTPPATVRGDAQVETQGTLPGTAVPGTSTRIRTQTDAELRQPGVTARNPRLSANGAANVGTSFFRTSQLIGTMVGIPGNQRWAKVSDVVFDQTGRIRFLVTDANGRFTAIPWQVGNYDFQNRAFVLDTVDQARIARIPTFTNFDQLSDEKYLGQVYQFFGVDANAPLGAQIDNSTRVNGGGRSVNRTTRDAGSLDASSEKDQNLLPGQGTSVTPPRPRATIESKAKAGARSSGLEDLPDTSDGTGAFKGALGKKPVSPAKDRALDDTESALDNKADTSDDDDSAAVRNEPFGASAPKAPSDADAADAPVPNP